MPLFQIQDSDRPMFIFATDWGQALIIWRNILARENPDSDCSEEQPDGINYVADDNDVAFITPPHQCTEAQLGECS